MDTDDHYVRFKNNNIVGWIIIIDALKLKIITLSRIIDFFVAYPSVFIIKKSYEI